MQQLVHWRRIEDRRRGCGLLLRPNRIVHNKWTPLCWSDRLAVYSPLHTRPSPLNPVSHSQPNDPWALKHVATAGWSQVFKVGRLHSSISVVDTLIEKEECSNEKGHIHSVINNCPLHVYCQEKGWQICAKIKGRFWTIFHMFLVFPSQHPSHSQDYWYWIGSEYLNSNSQGPEIRSYRYRRY